jgi:hypothetical protein
MNETTAPSAPYDTLDLPVTEAIDISALLAD